MVTRRKPRQKKNIQSDEIVQSVLAYALLHPKAPMRQVASNFGVNPSTVHSWLNPRHRGGYRKARPVVAKWFQVHGQEFKAQRNRHVLSPELERIIASAPEQHRKAVTSLSQVVKASPTTAYGMTDLLKLVEELTNLNQQARSIISDTQEAVDALNVVRFWLEDANELDKLKKQVAVLEDRLVLQTKLADKARSDALQVRQTHSDPTGR